MSDTKKFKLNLDQLGAIGSVDELSVAHIGEVLHGLERACDVARRGQIAEESTVASVRRLLQQDCLGSAVAEFKRVEEMKKLMDPYADIQKTLMQNSGVEEALKVLKQQDSLAGYAAKFRPEIQAAKAIAQQTYLHMNVGMQVSDLFRIPLASETAEMLKMLQSGTVAAYAKQLVTIDTAKADALASMSSPWMRDLGGQRSASALLELHGLGNALRLVQGFDHGLTVALRADFGDWRDTITFAEVVFEDPVARTNLYVERGFNTALTDFPDLAFREGLVRAGLDDDPDWDDQTQKQDPEQEADFRRANKCHGHLQRLERGLRNFINQAMTAQYGADWPKKRLPPKLLDAWEFKKSRAESDGVVLTMFIDVADFSDYVDIICRKDHWREVFQVRFKRTESVRESFQRLHPIRLATMHSRPVTKADELYTLAETMRLLSAIR